MSLQLEGLTAALAARYRLGLEIGRGGTATVYRAEDLASKQPVAIKVLREELAAIVGPQRFFREIEIAGRLSHSNIVPLLDSGEVAGVLYFVMPFIEGETLRQRIRREIQLPVAEAVRIASEVADGLAYSHLQGVVHRDIKPENILLEGGRALIADFGVARVVNAVDQDTLSTSGIALGTPTYMSPEQASGVRAVDARADIYSLGCVLYEMLAGEPPYTGPTAQAIAARHMVEAPRSLAVLRPGLAEGVQTAIETALAKVPADRFEAASAFAEALRVGLDRRASPALIARRARPRLRPGVIAAFGIAGLGLLLVLVIGKVFRPATVAPAGQNAGLFFEGVANRTDDPNLNTLTLMMETALRQSPQIRLLEPSEVTTVLGSMRRSTDVAAPLDEKTAREIALRGGVPLLIRGTATRQDTAYALRVEIEDVGTNPTESPRSWINTFLAGKKELVPEAVDAASAWIRSVLGEAARDVGKRSLPVRRATTASWAALESYSAGVESSARGRWGEAVGHLEQAIRLDTAFALAYARLGDLYDWLDMAKAIPYWTQALALARTLRLADNERFDIEAQLAFDGGGLRDAVEKYRLWSRSYPHEYRASFGLAMSLADLGRLDEASGVFHEMLRQWPERRALTRSRLAEVYLLREHWDSAGRYLDQGTPQPAEPYWAAVNDAFQGRRAFLMGNHAQSRAFYERVLKSSDPYWASLGFSLLASLSAETGQREAAKELLLAGLALDRKQIATRQPTGQHLLSMKLLGLAYLHYLEGNRAACAERSREASLVTNDPRRVARTGTLLARCGDTAAANALLHRLPAEIDLSVFQIGRYRIAGEIFVANGEVGRAVNTLSRAAELEFPNAEREYLARALVLVGDTATAVRHYRAMATKPAWAFRDNEEALVLPGFIAHARSRLVDLGTARARTVGSDVGPSRGRSTVPGPWQQRGIGTPPLH